MLFAVGFIVRPFGGWLFGHLADHYGRRVSLMLSVTADVLRLADDRRHADLCLDRHLGTDPARVARIVQGLSLGGEYGTSATYLTEVADQKHRGFYSSFQYVTLIGGQLCASVVLILLQQVFLTDGSDSAIGAGAFRSSSARCLPSSPRRCGAICTRRTTFKAAKKPVR